MASSNPFRKKAASTGASAPILSAAPISAASRFPPLDAIDTSPAPPGPSGADKKSKIIKKVRVLSPPPLSPDSPEWPFTAPPLASGLQQAGENDPFDAASTDESDREIMPTAAPPPLQDGNRVPANPFSKTLRDLETSRPDQELVKERREEGNTLKAANSARRSLDVNSFKRLLMTGNLGANSASAQQPAPTSHKSGVDSSSVSLSSSNYDGSKDGLTTGSEAQEVSLISRDTSDTPDDDLDLSDSSNSLQVGRGKKPPPPPSSRHGKSIKLELKDNDYSLAALAPKSPSDVNKPLPAAPLRRSFENDGTSPFDAESAGKLPEADAQSTVQTTPGGGRKAGPAPPPRRGHARAESKAYAASISKEGYAATNDETLSRSSSIRSKTERNRHDPYVLVPPPPPRRSHGGSRSTTIPPEIVAAVNASVNHPSTSAGLILDHDKSSVAKSTPLTEPGLSRSSQPGNYKIAAPPPPPARNTSVRRPASLRSVDSSSRRASAESKPHAGIAPPPPPRRQRGSSRSSVEGPYRRTSVDGVPRTEQRLAEESNGAALDSVGDHPGLVTPQSATDQGKGVDILADLTALQREVDALRGKLGP